MAKYDSMYGSAFRTMAKVQNKKKKKKEKIIQENQNLELVGLKEDQEFKQGCRILQETHKTEN